MASIGTTLPTTTTSGAAATSGAATTATTSAATDSLANQGTFLQLLVAQLKNQDPSQPVDGTTFVTQLAQFSTLEQELASRQDLDSISKDFTNAAASASATSTDGTTAATNGTSGTTDTTSTSGA